MKFQLGQMVTTRMIRTDLDENIQLRKEVYESIARYINADWGDTHPEDKKLNDKAIKNGDRIVAKYNTSEQPIFIITEWDRSYTTVMYTDEY